MPNDKMEKVNLRLYQSDIIFLQAAFPRLGYNAAVRNIVHGAVKRLQAEAEQGAASLKQELDPHL